MKTQVQVIAKTRVQQPVWPLTALTTKLFALMLSVTFLVTGCKKDPDVTPSNSVTANAGQDQEVQVGQTVTLDGNASQDTQGKPLKFQWAMVRKPAKSTVSLNANTATTPRPTFVPDETGEYELELTVSNDNGQSKDRVLVTASVSQPVAITTNITVKTVLTDRVANPELPDYIVTKSIAISNELTINPGVVIAFERDARLDLNDNGGLIIAKGEPTKRIRFTGVQQTKGFWAGIMIYSGSNANVFENVDIMYAGSRVLLSATKAGMAMFGGGKAQIALKNCSFSQNDGYGLYVQDEAILREFASNSFTNNTEAGILLDADNVQKLDAASTFTGGNGRNVVEIISSYLNGMNEIVWGGFADKTPYRVTGSWLTINTGLKLNPGVTIEMPRDGLFTINATGYLLAKGTTADKVTITGVSRTAGYWRGLISYSTSTLNVIENAEISNAGSIAIVSGKKANLAIYGNKATMSIKNTRISGSGGYGIYSFSGTTINTDAATTNTFESNAQGNVQVDK